MKKKLTDVLVINRAMTILEEAVIEFDAPNSVRWDRHRNAVLAHAGPVIKSIQELYEKGEHTPEGAEKANRTILEAINGEEVELQLPPLIPESSILERKKQGPEERAAMRAILDVVIGQPQKDPPDES